MNEKLKNIIESYLSAGDVLLELKIHERGDYVRIVIDSENGVTLSQTTDLSRKLKNSEEFNNELPEIYRLEISTPGVDRSLEFPFQYRKNIDRLVNMKILKDGSQNSITGKIVDANDESVMVSNKSGDIDSILYENIHSAKVNLSFK